MCNTACCYVTCNCQSKLPVHTHLDEFAKPSLENPSYLIIPAPGPLLTWPTSPSKCSSCSFLKLVFAASKTSDSPLHPYQERRPTRVDPLRPSPNLVTIPRIDLHMRVRVIWGQRFYWKYSAMGRNMKPGHIQEWWLIIPDLSAYIWHVMLPSEHFLWDFCNI